ncbi:MAG: 4-hydroxy-tetrahydrodipicolinate reductase [Chloroflexi bacterium]|nr:4-hydroxy-tetrahydrodipicolinate reductase [Chloroflexota bacterium]
MPIKVVVHGAGGKMGQEVLKALCRDPETKAVGAVDIQAKRETMALPDGSGSIPYSASVDSILERCQPQVMVDFSVAEACLPAVKAATQHRVNVVIGTTGLTPKNVEDIKGWVLAQGVGGLVAPNFALGAVMMIHLAKIVSKFEDFKAAEILEMHHDEKLDAPSGTALATAQAMSAARGRPFQRNKPQKVSLDSTRGGEMGGISIHSLRLPGLLAHQEVVFGALGQSLSIRHDTISRECFIPGVMMAIREVAKRPGFVYGLDQLLGL